jgi:hypothetical protein
MTDQKTDADYLSREFLFQTNLDAIKLVGAANAGGFLFAAAGLYYFGSKSVDAAPLLKYATAAYALGVLAFAVAHTFYILFIELQYATREPQRWLSSAQLVGHKRAQAASTAVAIGAVIWFIATALFLWALWHIKS